MHYPSILHTQTFYAHGLLRTMHHPVCTQLRCVCRPLRHTLSYLSRAPSSGAAALPSPPNSPFPIPLCSLPLPCPSPLPPSQAPHSLHFLPLPWGSHSWAGSGFSELTGLQLAFPSRPLRTELCTQPSCPRGPVGASIALGPGDSIPPLREEGVRTKEGQQRRQHL